MRDWNDVLPPDVADKQHLYERMCAVSRMRSLGFTLHQIAARMGVSMTTIRVWDAKGQKMLDSGEPAPIEVYLREDDVWRAPTMGRCHRALGRLHSLLGTKPRVRVKAGRAIV